MARIERLEAGLSRLANTSRVVGSAPLVDVLGHQLLLDDPAGDGLARPLLPVVWVDGNLSVPANTTTSATFAQLQESRGYLRQHPRMVLNLLVRASDGTTTGEVRLTANGVEVAGSLTQVTAGQYAYVIVGPVGIPGSYSDLVNLAVEGRRTAGSGSIGARVVGCYGTASGTSEPVEPGDPGTPGEPEDPEDPGETTLSAGPDATQAAGIAFTRTATDPTGVNITSRAWTIVSGPLGEGTTIATSAVLSWVPGSSPSGTTDIRQPVCTEMAYEIVSTAENSTTDWTTAYSYIEDINDERGYTGGLIGFTSATGDMLDLVEYYQTLRPTGNPLASYITGLEACAAVGFGAGASAAAASNLGSAYLTAWASAANTDPIFRKAQRDKRKSVYWDDALAQALADGVGPLGLALHYDILVNHGPGEDSESYGGILATARASAPPPSSGGTETSYLIKLCDVRDDVLIGWGDYQADGRSGIFRGLITAGKLSLIAPFSWSVYGETFTISTRPTPPTDAVIGTYVLRYTAAPAGSDDCTLTITST